MKWFLRLFLTFRESEESLRMLRRIKEENEDKIARLEGNAAEYRAKLATQSESINSLNTELEAEQHDNGELRDKCERYSTALIDARTELANFSKIEQEYQRQITALKMTRTAVVAKKAKPAKKKAAK